MKFHTIYLIIFCLLLSGCKGNNSSNGVIELPKPANGETEDNVVSDNTKDDSDKGKSPVVTQPRLQTVDNGKAYQSNKNIYIYEHSYKAPDDVSDHRFSYEYIVENKQVQKDPAVVTADKRFINNLDHRLGSGKNHLNYAKNYANKTKKAQVRDREVATELVTMKDVAISNTPDKFIINREEYQIHTPIKLDKNQITDFEAKKVYKGLYSSPIYTDKQQKFSSGFDYRSIEDLANKHEYSYVHHSKDLAQIKPVEYEYIEDVSRSCAEKRDCSNDAQLKLEYDQECHCVRKVSSKDKMIERQSEFDDHYDYYYGYSANNNAIPTRDQSKTKPLIVKETIILKAADTQDKFVMSITIRER
ncbi:hypothetical protein [Cysteiniphilum sp. JM-1]|uniref:hypothetical protein n=1 Tax=Cysteiniphilum sp. JM-1 TaxID=2610891 RepID=UPI0012473ED9|nr:hypothetical protein [Cysteiniphilum sp. JM-1]